MINNLPYFVPDSHSGLNVCLLMLILYKLQKTNRGKLLINNEKLLVYMYLIKNPIILDKFLKQYGSNGVVLSNEEFYSVNSISINLDPLFNNDWIKGLLKVAASRGFIDAEYRKNEGFMYQLTESGVAIVEKLDGTYFKRIMEYLGAMNVLKAESSSYLNGLLNDVFRAGAH